jgi:MFS family permease
MSKTPRTPSDIIDHSDMRIGQWVVVGICIMCMALDGYDVMSIALAGAGMSAEWGLSKAELGFLLPLEFLGMAAGLIFIGTLTDLYGRRLILLLCLIVVSIGMAASGISPNKELLAATRVFTGIGIGGILATGAALSSEYSNAKNRTLTVILVAGGYTFGIFLASKVAGPILEFYDWRMIFFGGALIGLILLPIVFFLVPESIGFLERRRPANAQNRIAGTLHRMGYDEPFEMASHEDEKPVVSPKQLFEGKTARITTVMIICYLGNILTYYYFVKWMPPMVTDLGYSAIDGTEVLAMISIGGLAGSVAIAILSRFAKLKILMGIALFGSACSVAAFPYFTGSLDAMLVAGAIAGFCLFAAIGGAIGLNAESFPAAVLGSGTGLVLGVGRGGAVIGPWVGGILFTAGMALAPVSLIMAAGSFAAGISLFFLVRD